MSESNDWEEMCLKRELYREAGAEEVWVVDEGTVRFFGEWEINQSKIAPGFPDRLS
jgi:Uma2 family endonuclease